MLAESYNKKKKELEDHFASLKASDAALKSVSSRNLLIISKAATIIMLYGCVEALIVEAFSALRSDIEKRRLTYTQLSNKVREAWIISEFSYVATKDVAHEYYIKKTRNLINSATSHITFNGNFVSSGNINGAKLRKYCEQYGIHFDTRNITNELGVLDDLVNSRNDLAHGDVSFYECGRQITINDLVYKKNCVIKVLEQFVDSFTNYISKDKHVRSSA